MSADGSRSENTTVIKLTFTGPEETLPRRFSGQMSKKDQALAFVWRRSEVGGEILFISVRGKDVLIYGSEAWIDGMGGVQTDAPAEATWPCSMDQANALIKKLKEAPNPGPVLLGGKGGGTPLARGLSRNPFGAQNRQLWDFAGQIHDGWVAADGGTSKEMVYG